MRHVLGDRALSQAPQLVERAAVEDDEGREDLFEHIAVFMGQKPQILAQIVADAIEFDAVHIRL